jgi:hypothetical protein
MLCLIHPLRIHPVSRPLLILFAYCKLIQFHFYLVRGDFAALCAKVRNAEMGNLVATPDVVERICAAIDMACIWYWKEVLCLQRSAVTACLLKRYGVSAQMIIGVQQIPFRAHAWVEVAGHVVNDKSYTPEMYAVLDKC